MKPDSNLLDELGDWAQTTIADKNSLPAELIYRQPTAAAAFSLACMSSGLEDKEIYMAVGIDAGTFSKIRSGNATLQADDLGLFCLTVGNRIYPEWLAHSIGCTLVETASVAERERDAERARRKLAEKKLAVAMQIIREMKAG